MLTIISSLSNGYGASHPVDDSIFVEEKLEARTRTPLVSRSTCIGLEGVIAGHPIVRTGGGCSFLSVPVARVNQMPAGCKKGGANAAGGVS